MKRMINKLTSTLVWTWHVVSTICTGYVATYITFQIIKHYN